MKRRDFLKNAAVGSAAVASLPVLVNTLAKPAWANGQTNFRFVALSRGPIIGGVNHLIFMTGDGKVNPSQVVGAGTFAHFDDSTPVPKTVLSSGTWKAKRLMSFDLIGTDAGLAAGVVEMEIHLVPNGGSVIQAVLKVVCNLGLSGIFTGLPEGFFLTIPGAPASPFVPFGLGLTTLPTANEQRD